MITFRRLTVADHATVFHLFSQMIRSEFPEYSPKIQHAITTRKRYWNKQNYLKRLENKNLLLLGAFQNQQLVGLLDAQKPFGGVSLGVWLMVHPDHNHQGIGSQLIKQWETYTLKQGGHLLYLFSPERNKQFYESRGFQAVGLFKKGWFGQDEWLFTKLFREPNETFFLSR